MPLRNTRTSGSSTPAGRATPGRVGYTRSSGSLTRSRATAYPPEALRQRALAHRRCRIIVSGFTLPQSRQNHPSAPFATLCPKPYSIRLWGAMSSRGGSREGHGSGSGHSAQLYVHQGRFTSECPFERPRFRSPPGCQRSLNSSQAPLTRCSCRPVWSFVAEI
ncbi:unnamed protein product, partial [Mycena citricolor]